MKKLGLLIMVAMLISGMSLSAWAVEFEYGGLFRVQYEGKQNTSDGNDDLDDHVNYIEQRLRMYFTFVASERLRLVTKWEADTAWGSARSGGDVGADAVILEMKNAYVDFMVPMTPVRATLGVQGLGLLSGWIVDDDFSAAILSAPFDPVTVKAGYIAARNEDVADESENVDDWLLSLDYDQGPFSASLVGFYQYGHDTAFSVPFEDDQVADNNLFDLGLALGYTHDMAAAHLNFVKNFGSYDTTVDGVENDMDYEGWAIEGGVDLFVRSFTFTLGGFFTSGDDDLGDGDDGNFRYPAGRSFYWSEILGYGTLDVNNGGINAVDTVQDKEGYDAADGPSNLWAITAGAAWQALDTTRLTFNYYYIGTQEDVLADRETGEMDNSIGHEVDFYVDQEIVDGLSVRLVGAYLFANDGFTFYADDDDAYEAGAQLKWSF